MVENTSNQLQDICTKSQNHTQSLNNRDMMKIESCITNKMFSIMSAQNLSIMLHYSLLLITYNGTKFLFIDTKGRVLETLRTLRDHILLKELGKTLMKYENKGWKSMSLFLEKI